MIVWRWNGTDLSQLTVLDTYGTVAVAGGKIVLTPDDGAHNSDGLGFYPPKFVGLLPGFSWEMEMEIASLGAGNGNSPFYLNLITNNTLLSSQNVFPSFNVGLGGIFDRAYDASHFSTIRDASHSSNPGISPTAIVANTPFRYKQSVASNGKHTVSIDGDDFETNLGPVTSGGNYAGVTYAGVATANSDFANTTNPLTVVGGVTRYAALSTPFVSPDGWKVGRYYVISDAGGNPVETILCSSINGDDVTFLRGQVGTSATSHANGVGIYNKPEIYFYSQNQSGGAANATRYSKMHITDDGSYAPPTPGALTVVPGYAGGNRITFASSLVSAINSDYISLERSTTSGSGFSEIAQVVPGYGYSDTSAVAGTNYFYKARARVSAFGSTYSSSYTSEASGVAVAVPEGSLINRWLRRGLI